MTSTGCRSREVDEIKMGLMHLVFWMFNRVFWIVYFVFCSTRKIQRAQGVEV